MGSINLSTFFSGKYGWLKATVMICLILISAGYAAERGVIVSVNVQLQAQVDAMYDQMNIPVNSTISAFMKEASYIIGTHNVSGTTYYYMINGTGNRAGRLEQYSTNASQVINNAIGNTTAGTVQVKNGVFPLDRKIYMKTEVNLIGMSGKGSVFFNPSIQGATTFLWNGANGSSVIDFSKASNCSILSGITINLNGKSNCTGIRLASASETLIRDVTVLNSSSNPRTGIGMMLTTDGDGSAALFNRIERLKITGTDIGIKFNGTINSGEQVACNRFVGTEIQTARIGMDFNKYSDHNWFYDTWIRNANTSIWLNSYSNTTDVGVYAQYFYGLITEHWLPYNAIIQSINGGESNVFIAPDFENTTTGICTAVTFTNTTYFRNLYIEHDSLYGVDWVNWGGPVAFNYTSVITQGSFVGYVPSGTVMNRGANFMTFKHAALLGDGKGRVLASIKVNWGSYSENITWVGGFDNSASIANEGKINVVCSSNITLNGNLELYVMIQRSN